MKRTCFGLLATMVAVSCSAEPERKRWTGVDVDALRLQLDRPSADFSESRLSRALNQYDAELYFVWQAIQLLAYLQDHLPESQGMPLETDLDLEGTQVYLRLACSGGGTGVPDPAFGHGSLQFYSPMLSQENLRNLAIEGQIFMEARECEESFFRILGSARLFYDRTNTRLALVPDFAYEDRFDGSTIGRFTSSMLLEGEHVDVQVPLDDGTSFTLSTDLSGDGEEFTILGADGGVECRRTLDGAAPCAPD